MDKLTKYAKDRATEFASDELKKVFKDVLITAAKTVAKKVIAVVLV